VQWRPDRRRTDPARLAAYDVLRAVDEDGAYPNLVATKVLKAAGLEGRDAAYATELAYGTLRQRRWLDAILAACVDRPLDQVEPPVLDLVRLGAYQLVHLATPPHAAVGETVQLARLVGGESRSRFVNAVLRRVAEHDADAWVGRVAPDAETDPLGHLAVVRSHPDWIAQALHDALTADGKPGWDDLEDLLIADNEAPVVTLAARPGLSTVEELLETAGSTPGRWSPYAVVLDHGSPGAVAAVRQHRAGVQDEGSQLVALALARAPVAGPESRWLDLCAGPGGKAALLGAVAAERGIGLTAVERAPHRADLVRQAVAGRPTVEVVVADGRDGPWEPESYDRVLLDAPCSGLGVLRRRPEARWRKQPADVEELAALQRELLTAAIAATRPGGLVGYATCTQHLTETTGVVEHALAAGGVERLDVRPLLPEVDRLGDGPDLRLWPHTHGTDGMYLALLRRTR
jgi:16S rRNA (cytosine967-C5)-methyltransferase